MNRKEVLLEIGRILLEHHTKAQTAMIEQEELLFFKDVSFQEEVIMPYEASECLYLILMYMEHDEKKVKEYLSKMEERLKYAYMCSTYTFTTELLNNLKSLYEAEATRKLEEGIKRMEKHLWEAYQNRKKTICEACYKNSLEAIYVWGKIFDISPDMLNPPRYQIKNDLSEEEIEKWEELKGVLGTARKVADYLSGVHHERSIWLATEFRDALTHLAASFAMTEKDAVDEIKYAIEHLRRGAVEAMQCHAGEYRATFFHLLDLQEKKAFLRSSQFWREFYMTQKLFADARKAKGTKGWEMAIKWFGECIDSTSLLQSFLR